MLAPVLASSFRIAPDPWNSTSPSEVVRSLRITKRRQKFPKTADKIEEYVVAPGDTVSGIAGKFGIDSDTIRWGIIWRMKDIKPGQKLRILPVIGVSHKVVRGNNLLDCQEISSRDAGNCRFSV